MKPIGKPTIYTQEDAFYATFLEKAIEYANNGPKADGVQFRQLVAAAGVVAKQRQTRGAMRALSYQIARDGKRGMLPDNFQIEDASEAH